VVAECGYLLVYDITGRPIKEFHLARGKHAIAWAEGLPSGLYILIARYDGTERVKSAFVR
ncbi:MAG: hypothetical protein ABIM74_10550, partial [candidate division WOR-3 bacterium]